MSRLLIFIGATVGSAVGWWMGESIGIMTAWILSVVGTAAGVYAGIRLARRYLS